LTLFGEYAYCVSSTIPSMKSVKELGVLSLVTVFGCGEASKEKPQPQAATPAAAQGPQYDIRGKVVSISADKKAVNLDHEAIPGVMMAMKMEYAVDNPQMLEGLKAGDAVQGKMKKEAGKYIITRLEKR